MGEWVALATERDIAPIKENIDKLEQKTKDLTKMLDQIEYTYIMMHNEFQCEIPGLDFWD